VIDLGPTSGLPLTLDEGDAGLPLRLRGDLQPGRLITRSLGELQPALADPHAEGPDPAYWMYNGVAHFAACDGRGAYQWRYDLTVLPPGRLGAECLRTMGHYHPLIPGADLAWPEVYEVLHGSALFVLQRADDHRAAPAEVRIDDLIVVRAEAGEQAMLPPNYGHWTVNATDGPLVIANWIAAGFESDYEPAQAARGPCCRVLAGEDGPRFSANPRYAHPPAALRHGRPVDVPELGLVAGRPIFGALLREPDVWRYVCDPRTAPVDLQSAIRVTQTDPFPP
jgi:glucose-6-phosphate isomerase